jgi:hypothetical protein
MPAPLNIRNSRGYSSQSETILKALESKLRKLKGVSLGNLNAAGDYVKHKAIRNTPIDTGRLREGFGVAMRTYPNRDTARVFNNTPYAIYVHENLDVAHPTHAHNANCHGEAKFLSRAVEENGHEILTVLTSRLRV